MKNTIVDGNCRTFQETAVSLDGKEACLVEVTANSQVQLATAGKAIGVIIASKLAPGSKDVQVRLLGKNGTVRMIQNAAIACGAQVMQDVTLPERIATFAQASSTRVLGRKIGPITSGAAGDIVEVLDECETVLTKNTPAAATTTAATINALTFTTPTAAECNLLKAECAKIATDLAALRTGLVTTGLIA